MHWLQTLDSDLFRLINLKLSNPVFDVIMPLASGSHSALAFFYPVLVGLAAVLIWKGRTRGLICVLVMSLVLAVGDGVITHSIKLAVARDRPFVTLADTHLLVGKGGSGSMPSGHAANWFSATMVALIYYRRSFWFMLPAAVLVSFSRIYNGVHYPSDVLAGAALGAGYAAAIILMLDWLWLRVGQSWFPIWWGKLPSLLDPPSSARPAQEDEPEEGPAPIRLPSRRGIAPADFRAPHVSLDVHWLRLGYVVIGLLLIARLVYIASGTIQLAEDEAYQWVWSKHLALSYFSKPPLIAYTQFLGTTMWGDSTFGVRFFSPVIAAGLSLVLLRFLTRVVNARAAFFLLLITTATPLMAAGSVLMTVDPLSVLFWTLAMVAGWSAIQDRATTRDWLFVGLWMGLGFLSKYTALLQLLCWAVFFVLWPAARKQLRRPGPYLALLISALAALPVLIWNAQHGWVTVGHVADDAGVGTRWEPTLQYVGEFLGGEACVLNPVFFFGMVWAAIAFWRRGRRDPRPVYFFSMGAPVFLAFLLHTFRSRALLNWVAPSILPLFCLMVTYWDTRWRLGSLETDPTRLRRGRWRRVALTVGLVGGFTVVILLHNTDVLRKVYGGYLPVKYDPLHRVRGWDTTAAAVNGARLGLLAEGKPVFIIADHYGLTGQLSFHLPEAREAIQATPLVYCRSAERPENQFYFWPGYGQRKGEDALYVRELNREDPTPCPIPFRLQAEFESITDLGVTNIMYHGYLLRPLQLFACRGLK